MGTKIDFLECLDVDVGLNILMRLDNPADLVRASAVSQYWRHFVISNTLLRHLCLTIFPQLSDNSHIITSNSGAINNVNVKSSNPIEMEILEMDHKAYASLLEALSRTKVSQKDCIANAVRASSTDHDPVEGIHNTLRPSSRSHRGYWSSKGESDPSVPETLTYRLKADISIVTEIDIRPFQVFWDRNQPICSANSVRFRMGYPKFQCPLLCEPDDNILVWTYTSPEFPMKQENQLQRFKLPEPVLCIGGFLQIELLGRVERAELDGLFYICINYVRVLGRPLKPAFDIEILKPTGEFVLKYYPESLVSTLQQSSDDDDVDMHTVKPAQMWELYLLQYGQRVLGAAADPLDDNQ